MAVAVVGLVPVVSQYREQTRLFTFGYVFLVAGMLATNLEAVFLGDVLNLVEHGVGIGAAGVMFFLAALRRRRRADGGAS